MPPGVINYFVVVLFFGQGQVSLLHHKLENGSEVGLVPGKSALDGFAFEQVSQFPLYFFASLHYPFVFFFDFFSQTLALFLVFLFLLLLLLLLSLELLGSLKFYFFYTLKLTIVQLLELLLQLLLLHFLLLVLL